jgi:hypothetical protein
VSPRLALGRTTADGFVDRQSSGANVPTPGTIPHQPAESAVRPRIAASVAARSCRRKIATHVDRGRAGSSSQQRGALPGFLLRFIGVCEVLGALGSLLPGLFRIRTELTPLAAAGLSIIMLGAAIITLFGGAVAPASIPLSVGLAV